MAPLANIHEVVDVYDISLGVTQVAEMEYFADSTHSNPTDPMIYILAVTAVYFIAIVLLMIKSIQGENSEEDYHSSQNYRNHMNKDYYASGIIKIVSTKHATIMQNINNEPTSSQRVLRINSHIDGE